MAQGEHEMNEITEKDRRVYYQNIVYTVCNQLDRLRGHGYAVGRTVCGTVETPATQVQDMVKAVVDQYLRNNSAEDGEVLG